MNTLQILGFLSAVICFLAVIPYIYDILKGKTKPERASWFIWTALGSIAFFSQLAKGATNSLWMVGFSTLAVLIVSLLSLKLGYGGFSKRDKISLSVAAFGILLWFITKEAAFALYLTIFVDLIGTALTTIKSYESPESETLSTWIIACVAGVLSALSVGEWNFILLIYPFYIAIANLAVVVAILLGRKENKHHKV